jgi:hypothetical protein
VGISSSGIVISKIVCEYTFIIRRELIVPITNTFIATLYFSHQTQTHITMLLAADLSHGGGKVSTMVDDDGLSVIDSGTVIDSIPIHPMGIKPLGNQYFEHGPNARQSTGIVGQLPDEMILHLFEYLDATSLMKLSSTCRFLYAFGQLDDLWKALFLE